MGWRTRGFAVVLAACLLLASCRPRPYECTDPLGCLNIPAGSPVVIGTLLASNGHLSALGTACLDSIQQVIKDRKSLLGHLILLDSYATDGTPESARSAATGLATDPNLLVVIGPSLSSEAQEASPVLTVAGIVSLSPVLDPAVAANLTEQVLAALRAVAIQGPDKSLIIPRQALWQTLELTR